MITEAPCFASWVAQVSPIPEFAPVIRIVWPFRSLARFSGEQVRVAIFVCLVCSGDGLGCGLGRGEENVSAALFITLHKDSINNLEELNSLLDL